MNLEPIQKLLETEMDRKEFLLYLGASLLAVAGVSGLLRSLAPSEKQGTTHTNSKVGYGNSTYGG